MRAVASSELCSVVIPLRRKPMAEESGGADPVIRRGRF